jgi:hypothetical protein
MNIVPCTLFYLVKLNLAQFHVGPALVTSKDAGDAVTLLQSLAGSTFDSSQLVLTASMGYQNVNEARLQELRSKHRPAVIAALEERSKGLRAWRDSQGLASKLYGFKHDPKSMIIEANKTEQSSDTQTNGCLSRSESGSTNSDEILISLNGDLEVDSVKDLQEQVICVFFLHDHFVDFASFSSSSFFIFLK